jgi:hypothetical protein
MAVDTNVDETKHIVDFLSKLDAKALAAAVVTFAVAFNVGYFYYVDISLFTLFSLSEHIVFAIRALPVAIAILISFIIVLMCIKLSHHVMPKTSRLIASIIFTFIWVIVLVMAAVQTGFESHYGLTFSFLVLAVCTIMYVIFHLSGAYERYGLQSATAPATDAATGVPPSPATVSDHSVLIHGTFWASTAIFSAFVIGFFCWTRYF